MAVNKRRIIVNLVDKEGHFENPDNYTDDIFSSRRTRNSRNKDSADTWRRKREATWQKFISRFQPENAKRSQQITIRPLFTTVPAARILELTRLAIKMDPQYPSLRVSNLLTYFVIDCPQKIIPEILRHLNSREMKSIIKFAYIDSVAVPAAKRKGKKIKKSKQKKHDFFTYTGIESFQTFFKEYLNQKVNQDLVDFEYGWKTPHPDLPEINSPVVGDIIKGDTEETRHGLHALGVICALDNDTGIVGIVPELNPEKIRRVSCMISGEEKRPEQLLKAVEILPFGGTLLIELALNDKIESLGPDIPLESDPADFAVIRLATALGRIVVEPAGNKGVDLETLPKTLYDPDALGDSDAIMTGAVTPEFKSEENWGKRVDCYGPASVDGLDGETFENTSAASAVIAGEIIAIQDVIQKKFGTRIDGRAMRRLLQHKGKEVKAGNETQAGVFPDLSMIKEVIDQSAELVKTDIFLPFDVYLRDNPGDSGDPFNTSGDFHSSPSIVISGADGIEVPPEAPQLVKNNEYSIHLRPWNRGVNDSPGAECRMYLWTNNSGEVKLSKEFEILNVGPVPHKNTAFAESESANFKPCKKGTYYLMGIVIRTGDDDYLAIDPENFKKTFINEDPSVPDIDFSFLETYVKYNNKAAWKKITVK